jgi:hypothetical protein
VRRLLVAAVTLTLAADASAFVRSRTKHGTAVYWPGACVFVQPDSDGSTDLAPGDVFSIIQKSMQNWQTLTQGCGYLQLNFDQPGAVEAHLDGKNVVKFRKDKWCHPEDDQNHDVCYDSHAAAITTVFYLDRPGEGQDGYIIDADIELNNIDFTFVNVMLGQPLPSPRPMTSIADLENTLTHELGHLQGLDHTCKDTATPANEVDENGNPPPPCGNLSTLTPADLVKVREATMFNQAMAGETKKRSPEADDVAGICAIYPLDKSSQHGECKHTNLDDYQTRGCQFVPGPAGGAALLLCVLALLATRLVRRRRS